MNAWEYEVQKRLALLEAGGGGGFSVAGAGLTSSGTTVNAVANADGSIVVNANDIQVGVISDAQHGTRGGGTTHANAIAGGAAGFLTGADKTRLDALPASIATAFPAVYDDWRQEEYRPIGNGAVAVNELGMTVTTYGTVSGGTVATTNLRTQCVRETYTTATTANAVAGCRGTANSPGLRLWRGNAAGLGGFHFRARFAVPTIQSGATWFVGVIATFGGIGATSAPSDQVNCAFVGQDAGDTNIYFMHNAGTGTCTRDLGSNTLATPGAADVYEASIYCVPYGSTIEMALKRIGDGVVSTYSASTNIPADTILMAEYFHINTKASGAASVIECMGIKIGRSL